MSKIKPYIKVEFRELRKAFKEHKLSRNERDLYKTMALFLEEVNSKTISASLEELCWESCMSDKPLKKALSCLIEKGFVTKLSKGGAKGVYVLNVGVFNGKKELETRVNIPQQTRVNIPQSHARALYIYKQNKKEQLQHVPEKPKQKPKRASSSGFSKSEINLAKRYTKLLQESGKPVKVFSRYVEAVCQKNEEMGTWENLRTTVEEMETQKLENQIMQDKPESQIEKIRIEPEVRMSRQTFMKIKSELIKSL